MDFYFSGVRSRREVDWLLDAGVERIMVDPFLDIGLVEEMIERWDQAGLSLELALDSGAYRVWREGINYSDEQYLEFLRRHGDRFVLAMSLDSIGNHIMSYHNYVQILAHGFDVAPVWHWGSPKTYLHDYLDMSPVVAIGKLVPPMREQDTTMLRKLRRLCEEYPNRFHLLGLCWPKAIDALHRDGTVYSADSSEWLVGARRGLVLFPPCGDAQRSIPATCGSPVRRTKCSPFPETGTGASDVLARPATCAHSSRSRDHKTRKMKSE